MASITIDLCTKITGIGCLGLLGTKTWKSNGRIEFICVFECNCPLSISDNEVRDLIQSTFGLVEDMRAISKRLRIAFNYHVTASKASDKQKTLQRMARKLARKLRPYFLSP